MNINLKPNLPLWCRGMRCGSQVSGVAKGILVVALTLSIALAVANMGIQAPARKASQLWPAAQILPAPAGLAPMSSLLVFSTYIGGSQEDLIRDVTIDASGNIYITGGTASPDFPTTPGAFQTTHGGWMDVFVAKLNPDGQLLWSTRIGGPDYDRAYGLEVDNQGYVYVAGRAGPGFPTTANAFQPTYQGFYTGAAYGDQNAFVCKLMPDGASLVFCSYIGPWQLVRDIDLDGSGAIYVAGSHNAAKQTSIPPAAWFANAFQKTSRGASDLVVAKIASNGSRVEWATYLGGSGNDGSAPTVRVKDDDGTVYVLQQTQSTDLPVTSSAYQTTSGGGWDFSLARFTASGSALIFSTYLGGSGSEFLETHELALDDLGNAYVSGWTFSPDFPTTAGALQSDLRGPNDIPLAKISANGSQLLTSTYLGGNANDGVEGIQIDAQGNVNIFGTTRSSDFQVTADALQSQPGGAGDFLWRNCRLTCIEYSTHPIWAAWATTSAAPVGSTTRGA